MQASCKKFIVGEKVFAKVKGFPPWPARIQEIIEDSGVGKYNVFFYGTYERGTVKGSNLYDYEDTKSVFGKYKYGRMRFREALREIEETPDIECPAEGIPIKSLNSITRMKLHGEQQYSIKKKLAKKHALKLEKISMAGSTGWIKPKCRFKRGRSKSDEHMNNIGTHDAVMKTLNIRSSKVSHKRNSEQGNVAEMSEPTFSFKATLEEINKLQEVPKNISSIIEDRSDYPKVLSFISDCGTKYDILYGYEKCNKFESDSAEDWVSSSVQKLQSCKASISSGEYSPRIIKMQALSAKEDLTSEEQEVLSWLEREILLVKTSRLIYQCLQPGVNVEQCLKYIESLLEIEVDPFMLIKNPVLVSTTLMCLEFNESPEIQEKGRQLINYYKSFFNLSDDASFDNIYPKYLSQFCKVIQYMPENFNTLG